MSDNRKRLPGSEKLTRPEDINALSKYLGDIKKTQEEHTELDKDNLEVPGRTTGRIPEIDGLYDAVLGLDVNKDISLDESVVGLETSGKDIEGLYDSVIGLEGADREINLGETAIGVEKPIEEVAGLYDSVIALDAESDISLENRRLDIDNEAENIALETKKEELKGVASEEHLGDKRVGLENTGIDIDLDNSVVNLKDVPEDIKLGKTKLDLKDADLDIPLEDEKQPLVGEEKDVDLTNYIDSIIDDRDIELEGEKLKITDEGISKLSNIRISGPEESEVGLEDEKIGLTVNKVNKLSKEKIDLDTDSKVELDSRRIELTDETEVKLENRRLGLEDETEVELSDKKLEIQNETEVTELSDEKLDLYNDPKVTELSDKKLELDNSDWNIEELGRELEKAPDDRKYKKALEIASTLGPWGMKVASLISSVLSNDSVDHKTAEWFDSELKKLLEQMGAISRFGINSFAQSGEKAQNLKSENAELEGTIINRPEDVDERGSEREEPSRKLKRDGLNLDNTRIQRPIGLDSNNDGVNDKEAIVEEAFTASDKPNYVYGKWGYGGNSRNMGYQTIPKYQLPDRGLLDALNASNYIRFGVESLFNLWNPKTKAERVLKPMLLNESLALLILAREQLEKLTKSNRERLPGDDMGMLGDLMSGGVSGAADNLKNNALDALQNTFAGVDGVDKLNPLNRPRTQLKSNGGVVTWVKEVTKGFDKGNNRQDPVNGSINLKELGKNLGKNLVKSLIGDLAEDGTRDISFLDTYVNNNATILTLENLCNLTNPKEVDSVEALLEILKRDDSYITTPSKFGTIEEGRYGTMTLDTNSYWEVVMEPFCHTAMNGGFSFLPAIEEINIINQSHHGVTTKYSKWLPIANFELQKSKLTNKSLGLYDGEIVYPVTSELSNELRMTIVDDQYKSWRTYFQKCADVAVYSSEAHELDYYNEVDINSNKYNINSDNFDSEEFDNLVSDRNFSRKMHITVVDRTKPLAALYKNITFLVKIYIMTPQYGTIRRFNLLCVLKDFEESYSGDIDAGGYDLNLSFSIVGENPPADTINDFMAASTKRGLSDKLGSKEQRELLNQAPKKKGGLIKLL